MNKTGPMCSTSAASFWSNSSTACIYQPLFICVYGYVNTEFFNQIRSTLNLWLFCQKIGWIKDLVKVQVVLYKPTVFLGRDA